MGDTYINVNLEDPEDIIEAEEIENSLEINADDNQGKTEFFDSDLVRIRFHSSSELPYNVGSSIGNAHKKSSNVQFEYLEYVTFSNAASASLTYKPKLILSQEWIGRSLGPVKLSGKTININAAGSGILKIKYRASYDLIEYTIGKIFESTQALVWADQNGTVAPLNLDFTPRNPVEIIHVDDDDDDEGSEDQVLPMPYTLTVLDFSSNQPVPGVSVSFNGISMGTTDAAGKVYLGSLLPGTYSIGMTKSGYFDSGVDGLNNDSIIVT